MKKGDILEIKALDKEGILDYLKGANENEMSSAINLIHYSNSLSGNYRIGDSGKKGVILKRLSGENYNALIQAEFVPSRSPAEEGISISVKDEDGRHMMGRFSVVTYFTGHSSYFFNHDFSNTLAK